MKREYLEKMKLDKKTIDKIMGEREREIRISADKAADEKLGFDEAAKEKDERIAQYEGRIRKMEFDSLLDGKLSDSRAKNKLAVRALLDMDKIMVDEDKLIGVDEQISSIKAKDGYLFENATTGGGANPSHVKETVDMDALSDKEYFKMKHGK